MDFNIVSDPLKKCTQMIIFACLLFSWSSKVIEFLLVKLWSPLFSGQSCVFQQLLVLVLLVSVFLCDFSTTLRCVQAQHNIPCINLCSKISLSVNNRAHYCTSFYAFQPLLHALLFQVTSTFLFVVHCFKNANFCYVNTPIHHCSWTNNEII
jgi:hypothetical protein